MSIDKKMQLVEDLINKVNLKGKYIKEAKEYKIDSYKKFKDKLNSVSIEQINNHNFKLEVKNKAHNLTKIAKIKEIVVKLERHAYAPEMNCLHFKSGRIYKVGYKTDLNKAIEYAANYMDLKDIKEYANPLLRHFRN